MATSIESLKASMAAAVFPHMPQVELSEDYLARRFSRPSKKLEHVVYEVARDAGLLHQYYLLREEMFLNIRDAKRATGVKDDHDDHSEVVVARISNHCIAGGRLTFTKARKALPMEQDRFSLVGYLPELRDTTYVEISRIAILPEFQNSLLMLELCRQLIKRCMEKKARYIVMLAPMPLAVNYRKAAQLFGLKWSIRNDITVPGSEDVLCVLDLAPASDKSKKREQLASA
jgi:hypothetical protein